MNEPARVGSTKFRDNIRSHMAAVRDRDERFLITVASIPSAIVVPIHVYDEWRAARDNAAQTP